MCKTMRRLYGLTFDVNPSQLIREGGIVVLLQADLIPEAGDWEESFRGAFEVLWSSVGQQTEERRLSKVRSCAPGSHQRQE